jgi:hypothetical protein
MVSRNNAFFEPRVAEQICRQWCLDNSSKHSPTSVSERVALVMSTGQPPLSAAAAAAAAAKNPALAQQRIAHTMAPAQPPAAAAAVNWPSWHLG